MLTSSFGVSSIRCVADFWTGALWVADDAIAPVDCCRTCLTSMVGVGVGFLATGPFPAPGAPFCAALRISRRSLTSIWTWCCIAIFWWRCTSSFWSCSLRVAKDRWLRWLTILCKHIIEWPGNCECYQARIKLSTTPFWEFLSFWNLSQLLSKSSIIDFGGISFFCFCIQIKASSLPRFTASSRDMQGNSASSSTISYLYEFKLVFFALWKKPKQIPCKNHRKLLSLSLRRDLAERCK